MKKFSSLRKLLLLHKLIIFALLTAYFAVSWGGGSRAEAASIKYIDSDGTEQTTDATAIESNTTQLSGGDYYYVTGTVTAGQIELSGGGTVGLILCDGAKLTATNITGSASLAIYAQSTGDNAGTLNLTNNSEAYIYSEGDVNIDGGTVNITSTSNQAYIFSEGKVTISGGTVNVTSESDTARIYGQSDVNIDGGQVTVTGTGNNSGIRSDGSITLGYTNDTDFILASGYYDSTPTAITPTIADEKNSLS